jgi:hypothetical protein
MATSYTVSNTIVSASGRNAYGTLKPRGRSDKLAELLIDCASGGAVGMMRELTAIGRGPG